jgi:phosphoglucosamine mutase
MLEASLVAGLLSIGADVVRIGVCSTPAVAYLTRTLGADAGVMISASHNPVEDNGIKFFGHDGFKLTDETELEIESLLDQSVDTLPRPVGVDLGTVRDDEQARWKYADYLESIIATRFDGIKVVLDCAHGAAYELAPHIFKSLGAEVITIGDAPNGMNINAGVGSTHIGAIRNATIEHGAQLGLSFDGDADRLIAVDEQGEEIDGDFILSICGDAMRKAGTLNGDTIVTTVMGNLGFFKAARELGLKTVQTAVGDRYVMEEMRRGGYNLGGEQSGHVIFLDYNTTGDGILTALQLTRTVVTTGKPLSELKNIMQKFPQVLVNVRVADKSGWKQNTAIADVVREVELALGDHGRLLVRPSGTESLIRIMAEGPDKAVIASHVERIANVVRAELGADGVATTR